MGFDQRVGGSPRRETFNPSLGSEDPDSLQTGGANDARTAKTTACIQSGPRWSQNLASWHEQQSNTLDLVRRPYVPHLFHGNGM